MENYTNSQNDLRKMDFLSVPDFDGDGMENWGINAYRYVDNSYNICEFGLNVINNVSFAFVF